MSASSVETILSRATSDAAFAGLLFSDPDQALSAYDLTPDERLKLANLSRADFDAAAAGSPEERRSFGVIVDYRQQHNETALEIR